MQVFDLTELDSVIGEFKHIGYVRKYVREIGGTVFVVENDYIDKDYLIDYASYYSRSFKAPERLTTRVHFFNGDFDDDDLSSATEKGRIAQDCGQYLGFSVVKPIIDRFGRNLLGRTALRTYPSEDEERQLRRTYIANHEEANLYGSTLAVQSVPFQSQDGEVGACASVALWVACHMLKPLFNTPIHSLAEITTKATSLPFLMRSFPSRGLILEQMLDYLRMLELEKDVFVISNRRCVPTSADKAAAAKAAIKAYVKARHPVIADLALCREDGSYDLHAAVITGYAEDERGTITELYMHDDGIGPYCRTEWLPDSNKLKNEWTTESENSPEESVEYESMYLEKLIVPVYPKLRLPFSDLLSVYKRVVMSASSEGKEVEMFYCQVNEYKRSIADPQIAVHDRTEILKTNLPRFLAVMRIRKDASLDSDLLYDATTRHSLLPMKRVYYANNGDVIEDLD